MKIGEKLKKEKVSKLRRLARQLNLTGYSRLKRQELIDFITADNLSPEEITAALDALKKYGTGAGKIYDLLLCNWPGKMKIKNWTF